MRSTRSNLGQRDAVWHRAYQRAQIAADTFIFQHLRHMPWQNVMTQIAQRTLFHAYTLVRAVFAGNVAEVAADAFLRVNFGDDLVIQIKITPIVDLRRGLA